MIGIIGGSGVYHIEGLENPRWVRAESAYGEPSDEVLLAELAGQPIAFLPRHGRGHRISPSDINFRANIDAMKRLGVTDIISVSAVGSLRENLP
ncbi:MAG: 5'-methylthioadenosine phosphorylase, partial [Gallionella sp.]|nr:5'-methylthioadenosine phosphorylase [Gallionella sp.]